MTQDEIIRMARECGIGKFESDEQWIDVNLYDLQAFAALVAAHERDKFSAVLRQINDSISLESSTYGLKQSGKCSYGESKG